MNMITRVNKIACPAITGFPRCLYKFRLQTFLRPTPPEGHGSYSFQHTHNAFRAAIICLAMLGGVTACSNGGGGSDNGGQADIGDTVSKTVTQQGGTLSLTTGDGSILTLEIPAGAVDSDTTFTITPQDNGDFLVTPAGLHLAPPARIRLTRQNGFEPQTHFAWKLGNEDFILPTNLDGDIIEAEIGLYGVNDETTSSNTGKISYAMKQTSGNLVFAPEDNNSATIGLTVLECSSRIATLQTEIQTTSNTDLNRATVLSNQLLAVRTACQAAEIAALITEACSQFNQAFQNAQVIHIADLNVFYSTVKPVIATTAQVISVGGECADMDTVESLIDAKFNQLIVSMRAEMNSEEYLDQMLERELSLLFDIQRQCEVLGLGQTCTKFRDTLFPKLLDMMRISAYQDCLEDNTALSLSQLLSADSLHFLPSDNFLADLANYSRADLEADIMNCTNPHLTLTVYANASDVPEEMSDLSTELFSRGVFDASRDPFFITHTTTVDVSVPRTGSISIAGDVRVPVCRNTTPSTDELMVKINNIEIARRPVSTNLWTINTSPVEIILSRDLITAGLNPATATSFTAEIFREGSGCGGAYPASSKIYTINANVLPFVLEVFPGVSTVNAGSSLDFNALLDGNDTSQVDWTATGGTISDTGLYTAGTTPGSFTVTASSQLNPQISASAVVTVNASEPTELRLTGNITVDYSVSLNWNNPASILEPFRERNGSLITTATAQFDVETLIRQSMSGALVGTFNTTGLPREDTGLKDPNRPGSCVRTSSETVGIELMPQNLPGILSLTSDGGQLVMEIQPSATFTGLMEYSGTRTDAGTSTYTEGCYGGARTSTYSGSGTATLDVRLPTFVVFEGVLQSGADSWTGSDQQEIIIEESCSLHFDSSLFGLNPNWLGQGSDTCIFNVTVSWNLQRSQ